MGGGGLRGLQPSPHPLIFPKVDLLLIENVKEKKNIAAKNTSQFKILRNYW